MRWTSWLPRVRQRRRCVVGIDVGPDACHLVVLSGSATQADTVCCAERLSLTAGFVAQGEVLQPTALGQWLKAFLAEGDYAPEAAYVGLDDACITHHLVTLAQGLSADDVVFQLHAEVQSVLPDSAGEVWVDYQLDALPSPAGEQRYVVQAAPQTRVQALQRLAQAAGLVTCVVEPRSDAAQRIQLSHPLVTLSNASAALALQCDEAFGLALRAWQTAGVNFVPYRDEAEHGLRRAWLLVGAVCTMGGAVLAAGFALVISSAAEVRQPRSGSALASARAYEAAGKAHAQAKAEQQRYAEQSRWLQSRQPFQAQSLQWSRVLSRATQGVWVVGVKQQGTRWTVHGEALSINHAQQLVRELKALDIWAKAPELPQLNVMPAASTTGLPVWQFRIEADLKVGA